MCYRGHPVRLGLAASSVILALVLSPSVRADDSQASLAMALQNLNQIQGRLDAGTRSHLNDIREILTRVYLHPDEATASEKHVAASFQTRDLDELKEIEDAVANLPGIATKMTFVSGVRKTPGGKEIGFVDIALEGRRKTIVEIPDAVGSWSIDKRAAAVYQRVSAVNTANPIWWTCIKPGQVNGEYVVATPQAGSGYMITADAGFANEYGVRPAELAVQLVKDIRSTFDSSSRALPTPHEAAVELRQTGDRAFAAGNRRAAEASYRQATQLDPNYLIPYERLARLCYQSGRPAQARRWVRKALNLPRLSAQQRAELQEIGRG